MTTTSLLRRYAHHQKGATAVLFALAVVPLLLAGGAAIDYLRYSEAGTQIQAALDAGALAAAAGSTLTPSERKAAAKNTFLRNIEQSGFDEDDVDYDFKVAGQQVIANANYKLKSGLMQIAGYTHMVVSAETEIVIPENKKAEVVLALDYSGSMYETSGGQVKYVAMKEAAKNLITALETTNGKKVRFGLVPFSHHVWTTLPKAHVVGQSGEGTWTGCTQDRKFPFNLTDASPTSNNDSKWGHPQAAVHLSDGCGAYVPNHLLTVPLTENFTALRTQLDNMRPYAWTHIALGAEFGYHLLSPNAPFTEGVDYNAKSTNKFLVILTDGRQTEPAFGPGVRNKVQGESNLSAICENAKDDGITVLTVAFDLEDEETRDRLEGCASDPATDFLIAENSAEIATAFADIQAQITAQMFISK